jgi:hypothetical protein
LNYYKLLQLYFLILKKLDKNFELERKIIKPKAYNEKSPLNINNNKDNNINPSSSVDNITMNIQNNDDKNKKGVPPISFQRKVWQLLKSSKWLVIFAASFSACSGAIWSAYGILIATSIEALAQVSEIELIGKEMAGWFILVAAIAGICISVQK